MTDCIESQLRFSFYRQSPLEARFDGGQMTSDAGLLLLREFDQRHELTAALADPPDPDRAGWTNTEHSSRSLPIDNNEITTKRELTSLVERFVRKNT